MQPNERFALYREMISCKYPLSYWRYNKDFELLESNSEDVHLWRRVFTGSGMMDNLREHCKKSDRPVLLDEMLAILWGAVCTPDEIYVVGPVMGLDGNMKDIAEAVRSLVDASVDENNLPVSFVFRNRLIDAMKQLPVVPAVNLCNDLAMLHCCLTGEHVERGDVVLFHRGSEAVHSPQQLHARDRHRTWMTEQALMRAIREGDLNYKTALDNAGNVSSGVPVSTKDPMQKAKYSSVTFIALCTRAAIEGGLTPEQAYSVGDSYLQQVEDALILTDLMDINHRMFADFVARVHSFRTNPQFSSPTRTVLDYIELHVEEPLSLEILAKTVGYSPYYLARKFKQETGTNVNYYIQCARVERAKSLLLSTDDSVRDIAERLQFCSGGYFANIFQSVAGITPQEYRKQNRKG